MKGGNLQDYITERREQNKPFSELEASIIMKSILQGV